MEEKNIDFDNIFVQNVALGLGISLDREYLDSEELIQLQGTISNCVICYYFAKTHLFVLEDTIKRHCLSKNKTKKINDGIIRGYITKWQHEKRKTGKVHDLEHSSSNLGVFDQNFAGFEDCMMQIDHEFEENQDCIQYVTNRPIMKLEDEIAERKSVQNYISPEMNLDRVSDYYALKDVGIENYLEERSYQQDIIYIK